jgi:hypothetical protein
VPAGGQDPARACKRSRLATPAALRFNEGMPKQMFFMFALMGLFLGYSLFTIYKRKKGMPDAARMFFERTGYRYADILGQPLEAHIAHGEQLMKGASKGYRLHMVRDFYGLPIHSVQEYSVESGLTSTKTSMSYAWSLPLQQPARFHLQIAEKSLRGFAKGVKEAFSSSERVWNQQYPHEVKSGDPQFDGRFFVYSDNPQAAYAALQAPALRQVLLQCTEVDLTVYPDQLRFADPLQKNIMAAMGGTFGAMSMGTNPSKMMELTIPVHDHMAHVLATTYQACA